MKRSPFIFGLFTVCVFTLLAACTSSAKLSDGKHFMPGKENIRTPEMMTETYNVPGNCEICKNHIETAARSVQGVTQADWSLEYKTLKVMYFPQQTTALAIQTAVANAGYDTDRVKATDSDYAKLKSCCRYERLK